MYICGQWEELVRVIKYVGAHTVPMYEHIICFSIVGLQLDSGRQIGAVPLVWLTV